MAALPPESVAPPHLPAIPWTRWAVTMVLCVTLAHLLDAMAWQYVRVPGVNDKDWGRLLRSIGYLPLWGAVGLALWLHHADGAARRARTALVVLAPTVSGIVAEALKLLVRRVRPDAEQFGYAFRAFSEGPWSNRGMGMPSSHTMVAFGGAFAMARLFPRTRWVWYVLAAGCALTRVMATAHFLSDTVVAAGVSWLVVALLWSRKGSGLTEPS